MLDVNGHSHDLFFCWFCRRPGLSKFFGGKARSFSSLADVSTTSDLEKPNNPYAKRRRMGGNGGPLNRPRSYPHLLRASLAGISKKTTNRSTLTIAIKLGGLTEENKDYVAALPGASRSHWTKTIPSRSFSLTDLPVVSRHASPPFRKSFAQPWFISVTLFFNCPLFRTPREEHSLSWALAAAGME